MGKPRWATTLALAVVLVVAGTAEPAAAADACATNGSDFTPQTIAAGTGTIRVGCARDAGTLRSLASSDTDLVAALDFNITQGPDQWRQVMQEVVDAVHADQSRGLTLSDSLTQRAQRSSVGVYEQETGVRFNASIQIVGSSLVIVTPTGEVSAAANWWQKFIATAVSIALGIVFTASCLAVAPAAVLICNAIGGGVTGMTGELINALFDGRSPGDWEVWAEALAVAAAGAVGGALLGDTVSWATTWLRPHWVALGESLSNMAARWTWAATVRAYIGAAFTPEFAAAVIQNLERLRRGVGAADVRLKVMPLGDSITYGVGSGDDAGYRRSLHGLLTQQGASVDFVGSVRSGPVPDAHEGHSGWVIDQISGIADGVLTTHRPNVVLLHIGTNDMNNNVDPGNAHLRLGRLIDQIFRNLPEVTLLVSTIVPATIAATQSRIVAYNAAISGEVASRRSAGKRVELVSMNAVTTQDLADFLHPNDRGYQKMAGAFYQAILEASDAGWIAPAPPPSGGPVRGWYPQGVVATGTMAGGSYPGSLALGGGDQVHFADLNGDARADYIVTHANQSMDQWFNGGVDVNGTINWVSHRSVATLEVDLPIQWRFADLNADGSAEVIKFSAETGHIFNYRADGTPAPGFPSGPAGWHFFEDFDGDGWADWLTVNDNSSVDLRRSVNGNPSPVVRVASGVGVSRDRVRFADVNGDRRADYLVLNPDSSVQAWLNGGPNPAGGDWYWYPQGTIGTGVGVDGSRIQFADVDGDGREDYLDVDPATGDTRMWRNLGPPSGGGWPWIAEGSITAGSSSRIIWADINGDRRADYLQVNANSSVQAWINGGPLAPGGEWYWLPQGIIASGVGAPGANIRFADLNADGRADYLVLNPNSSVQAWLNGGPNPAGGDWYWSPQGTVASGVGAPGENIRFADLNADGRTDYVRVNDNSSAQAWLNGGPLAPGGEWYWLPQGTFATGVGVAGSNVRIADLTGDRRADYLVLHDNSAVDMWTNGGPLAPGGEWYWLPQGTVASGVFVPGSRIQFADFDGDGRADYLDVNPGTGATRAWINAA